MNWEKLKKEHYFREPVEHIVSTTIFPIKEYDTLYENQNKFTHTTWQEFDAKYRTGFELKDDITEIDFKKEIIALWFFRERSDNNSQPDINVAGKKIRYHQNKFLLTPCKDITIEEQKRKYIRRPCIQLDISKVKYEQIIERLK